MPATPPESRTASEPMTPERWRAVDAILQAALASEPGRREALVAEACAGDPALRHEVTSLLAAHDGTDTDFLERPAAAVLGVPVAPTPAERLSHALAGRYVLEREVAHGGMATVYVAHDVRHGRRVAIKALREEVAAAVGAERFLAEIRVTASLQHPHVLPLFDSGSADGLLWYVMPYVEGETLRARLAREGRLPPEEAVRLAREIADALDHAHARGVVHRDVKPENVLLQGGHALVADFGIALALEQAGGERLTRTGLAIGTPQYMAPEQASGDRAIDARADVYALGAVLYEMLAGAPPFAAPTRHAVMLRLLHEPPAPFAARGADVAPFLETAVRRALAKRPDDRFASVASFAAALAVPLDEPGADAAPAGAREPRGGRGVPVLAVWYLALAALGGGLVGGWALARSPTVAGWETTAAGLLRGADGGTADARAAPLVAAGAGPSLLVIDREGRTVREIPAERPWTPRFSPDGRRVAYGAFGAGRGSSDLWVTDLESGATQRLTDDVADANDPQWSPDGSTLAYSAGASGGKDLLARPLGGGPARVLAARGGTQFASDWLRDGSALLVTEEGEGGHDVLVQPTDGSAARAYAATPADETAARASPDGRWVAYTSNASGRPEVYLDSFRSPGRPVLVGGGGGAHPTWRGDGRELYFWRDGALVAVRLAPAGGDAPPAVEGRETVLFRAPYPVELNTMYDVSPDGRRFVIARQP